MIFKQQMQYNAPIACTFIKIFPGMKHPDPFWCCDPRPGPLLAKILAARLVYRFRGGCCKLNQRKDRGRLATDRPTFRTKLSSGCRRRSRTAVLICASKARSRFRGTSSAGNRSLMRPMKTGRSSVTIFGMLKSRSARISTWTAQER